MNKPDELRKLLVNGVELHYIEHGHGIPVIFVHGSVEDYRYWSRQIAPVSESYRVIAYSRRYNHPNSGAAPLTTYSAIIDAEDLAALIQALGLEAAHIVGHSYGAYTALLLAVKRPDLVRALVLAEPPVMRLLLEIPDGNAAYMRFMDTWSRIQQVFQTGDEAEALRVSVERMMGIERSKIQPAWINNMLVNVQEWKMLAASSDAYPPLAPEDIKRISAPTLMLSSNPNSLIDGKLAHLLPNVERTIIPKATHEMWAEYPDLCRERMITFLEKH